MDDGGGVLSGSVAEGRGDVSLGDGSPGVGDALALGESLGLIDGLALADAPGLSLRLVDGLTLGEGLGSPVRLSMRLSHTLWVGTPLASALGDRPRMRLGVVLEPSTSRKAMSLRSTREAWPFSQGSGFVNRPLTITSKCRWQPVE